MKSKFLGELGFKSWVCENHFISYSCIFFKKIFNALRRGCIKFCWFSKIHFFFLQFRSIEFVFRPIKIAIKNFSEPLLGSIDRTCFSINQTSWIKFFKISVWLVQNTFSKVFSTFLPLSDSAKQNLPFFVIFLRIFCNIFLSQSR